MTPLNQPIKLHHLESFPDHQSKRKDFCLYLFRDDAFSDSLSQKADSEASSGPLLDDKASSKNDLQSPCEPSPDYNFGGVMGRSVADCTEFCFYLFHIFSSSKKNNDLN